MVLSKSVLSEARLLYQKEEFVGSKNLIERSLQKFGENGFADKELTIKVLALLGWNIIALRELASLGTWEQSLSDLGIAGEPEFELIRIWVLGIEGKFEDAIFRINRFLNTQGTQVHKLHPDFLMVRGHFHSRMGNSVQPIQDCEAAFSLFLISEQKFGAGKAANILGIHYRSLGNFPKAEEWYSRSYKLFDALNLQKKKSILSLNRGIIQYKLGDFAQSIQLIKKTRLIGNKEGWPYHQCLANIALGTVYRMTRQLDLAQHHLQDGLMQAQAQSMAREEALAQEFLGDIQRDKENFTKAQTCYAAALAIITPLAPEGDVVSETHRRIGECHMLSGEYLSAKPHLEKALKMTRLQGDRFEEAVTLRVLAELYLATNKAKHALKYIIPACDILEEIGANYELAIARFKYAEILLAESKRDGNNIPSIVLLNQAWRHASDAQALFNSTGVHWWMAQTQTLVNQIAARHNKQEKTDLLVASSLMNTGAEGYNPGNIIVHKSSAMRQLLKQCDLYAASNSTFLIKGRTGTGKELIARRLHEKSGRPGKLIAVNVASISPSLFEREFFGHVKGAFSGADSNSIGYAELAHKGTLFLDEIGELPLELQPKLLRLLQDGVFNAVGDPSERTVDIRIIAATNVDLFQASQKGTFREDLYYRLQILSVTILPLKDRPEDILPLVEHFLSIAACQQIRLSDYLNTAALDLLETYSWPGNVREIISVCQQIHLQVSTVGTCSVELGQPGKRAGMLCGPKLMEMEAANGLAMAASTEPYQQLVSALETTGGNRQKAAQLLKISRSTLYRQLKEFGI